MEIKCAGVKIEQVKLIFVCSCVPIDALFLINLQTIVLNMFTLAILQLYSHYPLSGYCGVLI